ncbi:TPA: hypothetical protein ACT16M_005475, partial [Klebsiella pneumoniae]
LPVLPVSRQKRPESLSGGADKGCYGKSMMPGGYGKIVATEPADAKIRPILIRLLHQECSTIQPLQVFGPQRGLFLPVVGADKEKGRISGPFRRERCLNAEFQRLL